MGGIALCTLLWELPEYPWVHGLMKWEKCSKVVNRVRLRRSAG